MKKIGGYIEFEHNNGNEYYSDLIKPEPALSESIINEHKNKYDGSIMVCDDCGVVLIPKEYHTKEFFDKIVAIEAQEDIWFDRLDRKKENTFEIVCLKKYLYENEDKKD